MFIFYFYLIFYFYAISMYRLILPNFVDSTLPKARYLELGIEIAVVLLMLLLLYAITRRKRLSFMLTLLIYTAFLVASVVKINLLGLPISHKDLIVIDDLVRTWGTFKLFLPYIIVFLIIIGSITFFEIKKTKPDSVKRSLLITFIFSILIIGANIHNDAIRILLKNHGVYFRENGNQVKRGYRSGLFVTFVQAWFFSGSPPKPEDYSEEKIKSIIEDYGLNEPIKGNLKADNVIVLLTESFIYPEQFGWETPPKHMQGLKSMMPNSSMVRTISPVFGGRSINAEFELNTGLTNRFVPPNSTPYREYISQDLPSMARVFNDNGFETSAIQAVEINGFGYEKIYEYLGFDQKFGISNQSENIKPDPSGRSVASEVLAEKIFSLTDSQDKSFIFAFPNSTHAPWDLSHYSKENRIEVSEPELTKEQNEKLSAYYNALDHFDELLQAIFNKFKDSDERTLLFIVGDHQPFLSFYNSKLEDDPNYSDETNEILKMYTSTFFMWSNFSTHKIEPDLISINLISAEIIEQAGVQVSGFMKLMLLISKHFNVISHFISTVDAHAAENFSTESQNLLEAYELIHYDLLFGDAFLYQLTDGL